LNPAATFVGNVPTVWTIVGLGDFNGDGKTDILWRDTSGNVAIWEMNGTSLLIGSSSFVGNVPASWSIVGTGDFNGDGKSDILWRDTSGNVAIWEMNGTNVLNGTATLKCIHRLEDFWNRRRRRLRRSLRIRAERMDRECGRAARCRAACGGATMAPVSRSASTVCGAAPDATWHTISLEMNRLSPRGGTPLQPAPPETAAAAGR
jgi:hypothetical protein